MTYTVVNHADAMAVEREIVALWPANQPTAMPWRYRWYYHDNPQGVGEVFTLEWHAPPDTRDVVGWTGFGPRLIYDGHTPLRAVDHADFAVDKPHRTLRPALMLQRMAVERALERADLAYGFPNEQAIGIFLRLGYRTLGTMERHVCVLRHGAYLRRLLAVPLLTDAAGAFVDTVRFRALGMKRTTELIWLDDFDPRFDRLYDEVKSKYGFLGCRRAADLAWRFWGDAAPSRRIAVLSDGDRLAAYAVIADAAPHVAVLVDFLPASPGDLTRLLKQLLPALRRAGYISVTAYFLGATWVTDVLRSCGFQLREGGRVITMRVSDALETSRERYLDSSNWYLTSADRDFF